MLYLQKSPVCGRAYCCIIDDDKRGHTKLRLERGRVIRYDSVLWYITHLSLPSLRNAPAASKKKKQEKEGAKKKKRVEVGCIHSLHVVDVDSHINSFIPTTESTILARGRKPSWHLSCYLVGIYEGKCVCACAYARVHPTWKRTCGRAYDTHPLQDSASVNQPITRLFLQHQTNTSKRPRCFVTVVHMFYRTWYPPVLSPPHPCRRQIVQRLLEYCLYSPNEVGAANANVPSRRACLCYFFGKVLDKNNLSNAT